MTFLGFIPGLAPGHEEDPMFGGGALGTTFQPWAENLPRGDDLFQIWLLAMFGANSGYEGHPFRVPFWLQEIE